MLLWSSIVQHTRLVYHGLLTREEWGRSTCGHWTNISYIWASILTSTISITTKTNRVGKFVSIISLVGCSGVVISLGTNSTTFSPYCINTIGHQVLYTTCVSSSCYPKLRMMMMWKLLKQRGLNRWQREQNLMSALSHVCQLLSRYMTVCM